MNKSILASEKKMEWFFPAKYFIFQHDLTENDINYGRQQAKKNREDLLTDYRYASRTSKTMSHESNYHYKRMMPEDCHSIRYKNYYQFGTFST